MAGPITHAGDGTTRDSAGLVEASAPIRQEDEQVIHIDHAVAVEVSGAVIRIGAFAPFGQHNKQILDIDDAVAVEVGGFTWRRHQPSCD